MQVNPVADIHQSSCFCLAFDPVKHKEKKKSHPDITRENLAHPAENHRSSLLMYVVLTQKKKKKKNG